MMRTFRYMNSPDEYELSHDGRPAAYKKNRTHNLDEFYPGFSRQGKTGRGKPDRARGRGGFAGEDPHHGPTTRR